MPSILKKKTNLLPGITLISQFGFTFIFGPLGLVLSLPISVVIQVIIKEIIIFKKANVNGIAYILRGTSYGDVRILTGNGPGKDLYDIQNTLQT